MEGPLSEHGSDMTGLSRRSLSRESSLADILEGVPPTFTRKPKAQCVDEGEDVTFECRLAAIPEPTVTWTHKSKTVTYLIHIVHKRNSYKTLTKNFPDSCFNKIMSYIDCFYGCFFLLIHCLYCLRYSIYL